MRYLLTALVALLLLPAPASATELATDRPQTTVRISESLRIAHEFWGVSRPVRIYAASDDALSASIGRAALGVTSLSGDAIWINDVALRQNTYAARIDTCSTIVHEYGHVLGLPHNDNPRSVMYGGAFELNDAVYGCYKRFMPRGKARQWRNDRGAPRWMQR